MSNKGLTNVDWITLDHLQWLDVMKFLWQWTKEILQIDFWWCSYQTCVWYVPWCNSIFSMKLFATDWNKIQELNKCILKSLRKSNCINSTRILSPSKPFTKNGKFLMHFLKKKIYYFRPIIAIKFMCGKINNKRKKFFMSSGEKEISNWGIKALYKR